LKVTIGPISDAPPVSFVSCVRNVAILISQLLGLLVTFIGEQLTIRLVHHVWADLPVEDKDLDEQSQND
jgi:hypothetical protein